MHRFRHVAAWGLLVTLVVGAVAGPLVHRLQHGAERAVVAEKVCHPASVHHADTVTLAEATGLDVLSCDLCATRLPVVLPALNASWAPRVAGTTRVVLRTHLAPVHVATDRTIRGPPFISGARLA